MKPLIANPKRNGQAQKWHREVFAMFGGSQRICALCGKPGATDAAHVIGRGGGGLGPLRYADPRLGRPAHRTCHSLVDEYKMQFSLEIRRDAVMAHNLYSKQPMEIPEE